MAQRPNQRGRRSTPAEPTTETEATQPTGSAKPAGTARRSWLDLFRSIQGIVAFVGVVLAGGFSLTYMLFTLGIMGRQVEDIQLNPMELPVLREAEITGQNLDLVTEILLGNETVSPLRVFHKLDNASRISFIIPGTVPDGKYRVDVNWKSKIPFATTKTYVVTNPNRLVVDSGRPPRCEDGGPPIIFAGLDWQSAKLQNSIARFIIEEGYGCLTEIISGGAKPLWKAQFKGSVQVLMEAWLPNYGPWWDQGLEEGLIIPLGKSLDDNWQSGFVVPAYMVRGDVARVTAAYTPDRRSPAWAGCPVSLHQSIASGRALHP